MPGIILCRGGIIGGRKVRFCGLPVKKASVSSPGLPVSDRGLVVPGPRNTHIGPQGVGKTHLAMAYGRQCCMNGMKTYFLKATELNQRLADAVKYGREGSVINGLVKPTCLIIDEIGRCVFNNESTRMSFDIIDRRYNKEGPNIMIFTSNKGPDKWGEFFSEDSSLLCALDRIFDDATVFMMKGDSYRGKKLETIAIDTGRIKTGVKLK